MSNDQQRNRDARGRYRGGPQCDACNRPAGYAYASDPVVCGSGDGPGFILCTRPGCSRSMRGMSVDDRRAHYERMRAARASS